MPGTLFVVATPIGNLEDITMRALRVLREATLIAAEDTRRTSHLLARYVIQTPTTSLHEHNERSKTASIIARLERGETVALVSDAGTPTISDPGQRLIRAAIESGIPVETIPGPNAAIAALAVSGFEGETFTFLGFPPTKSKDRTAWLEKFRTGGPTVVFYEAPHRIRRTLELIQAHLGDLEVVIARELTKIHEELVRGPISKVLKVMSAPKGEFTVVAYLGLMVETMPLEALPDQAIRQLFGDMTNNQVISRRSAVTALAKEHRMAPKAVYAAIERAKKSGE